MALDIYVMPLWRFKAGDFSSPIEREMGLRPRIVTPEGFVERPTAVGWLARWRARREVASLQKSVGTACGTRVVWRDDGDVVYTGQGNDMLPIRVYARWLDFRDRFPTFEPPPDDDWREHPVWKVEYEDLSRISCPHLLGHSFFSGYLLPCEFARPVEAEPYRIFNQWPAAHSVGSSPRLLRELEAVGGHLGPLAEEELSADEEIPADDPLFPVKVAFRQLRKVVSLSCRHGLPVIFWG